MKKRTIAWILCAVLCLALVGCGKTGGGEQTPQAENTAPAEQVPQEESAAPAEQTPQDEKQSVELPKQIEMIVPYSAGGGTDNAARVVADALSEQLGVKVIVTNQAGAASEIGDQAIAEAASDGSVIGVLGAPDPQYLVATKDTAFTMEDFRYLAVYNLSLPMLIGKADGFTTVEEIFDYGKEHPGEITIGVSGGGPKTEAAILMSCGEFEATVVDFGGSADVSTALLSGDIDLACLTPSYLSTLEPEGCVPLVYFSELKIDAYSDVPSLKEMGFDVNIAHNPVVVIPAGAPEEIVSRYQQALDAIGQDPAIKEAFEALNTTYYYMSGEELDSYMDGVDALITDMVERYSSVFQ